MKFLFRINSGEKVLLPTSCQVAFVNKRCVPSADCKENTAEVESLGSRRAAPKKPGEHGLVGFLWPLGTFRIKNPCQLRSAASRVNWPEHLPVAEAAAWRRHCASRLQTWQMLKQRLPHVRVSFPSIRRAMPVSYAVAAKRGAGG